MRRTYVRAALLLGGIGVIAAVVVFAVLRQGDRSDLVQLSPTTSPLDAQLLHASADGDASRIRSLLAQGASVVVKDAADRNAVSFAADAGCLECVRVLVESGCRVNNEHLHTLLSPLHIAATRGDAAMVEYLVERGAEFDVKAADGNTPILSAALAGHWDIVEMFTRYGADPSVKNSAGVDLAMLRQRQK